MAASIDIEVRGEAFRLHGERLLSWPREKILMVADMHLGKAETFRHHGMWLPSEAQEGDLATLARVASTHGLEHVVFLGDFVHARAGVTEEVVRVFENWRTAFAGEITILIGNHDRPLLKRWPEEWSFAGLRDELRIRDFTLTHDPPAATDGSFTWCGHIHPKLSLRKGAESLYLPGFVIAKDVGYVPAFSSLAGGAEFPLKKGNRYFATTGLSVLEIEVPSGRSSTAPAPRDATKDMRDDGAPVDGAGAGGRP